jgi:hypothetical protein
MIPEQFGEYSQTGPVHLIRWKQKVNEEKKYSDEKQIKSVPLGESPP